MGKINWGRVLLGGVLAGLIINIFEWVTNGIVLKAEWDSVMRALGHPMSSSAIPIFVIWGFLVGIAATWLYAAARSRFGAGPKTAMLTGFAFWIFGFVLPTLGQFALQLFPVRLLMIGLCVGLVEILAASFAGGWVYRE
jgi:hypothetical protein